MPMKAVVPACTGNGWADSSPAAAGCVAADMLDMQRVYLVFSLSNSTLCPLFDRRTRWIFNNTRWLR